MQVIPAIDLMKGKVVRLIRGDPEQATFYDSMGTPVEIALKWKSEGAQRLHIIDLDAAFGKPDNLKVVSEIAKATGLPIQVGGGIRSVEAVERLLNAGIQYVILGSLAFTTPAAVTAHPKEVQRRPHHRCLGPPRRHGDGGRLDKLHHIHPRRRVRRITRNWA